MSTCKNCLEELSDKKKFCSNCGQPKDLKLSVGLLFKDTISNYLSLDAKLFKSLLPLLFKPGYLAKAYIDGKRQNFMHPAKFYFFSTVILFLIISLNFTINEINGYNQTETPAILDSLNNLEITQDSLNNSPLDTTSFDNGLISIDFDNVEKNEVLTFFNKLKKVKKMDNATISEKSEVMGVTPEDNGFKRFFIYQMIKVNDSNTQDFIKAGISSLSFGLFILIPVFAFLLKVFFRKNEKPFVHHLVFTFYLFTFLSILFSLFLLGSFFVHYPSSIVTILILLTAFYYVFGLKYFYQRSLFRSFTKAFGIFFMFMITLVPFTLVFLSIAFISV